MPRYLVQRYFSATPLTDRDPAELVELNRVNGVVWLHSYVTEDPRRTFCLYEAESPEAIRAASRRAALPVESIDLVTTWDPYAYQPLKDTTSSSTEHNDKDGR